MADFGLLAYVYLSVGLLEAFILVGRINGELFVGGKEKRKYWKNLFQLLNIIYVALESKQQNMPRIQEEDCFPISKENLAACTILRGGGGALKEE